MLLCCKSGSVTGQPLPVLLSKCSFLHFEASLEPYTALTIQAILRGAKSFVWSKLLCFCFLFLFLVHAVLNRESFLSGGHWEEKSWNKQLYSLREPFPTSCRRNHRSWMLNRAVVSSWSGKCSENNKALKAQKIQLLGQLVQSDNLVKHISEVLSLQLYKENTSYN